MEGGKKLMKKGLNRILSVLLLTFLCTALFVIPSSAQTAPINSWIDVKRDYGAVGDGVTDDLQALQRAIDAANNAGGGVVWLPEGNYRITAQLSMKSNVIMKGAGQGTTTITRGGSFGTATIYAANCDHFAITDMTLENTNTGNNGIFATSCVAFRFENLTVNYAKNCGIAIYGVSSDGYINNCYFYECGDNNVSGNYNQALAIQGNSNDSPITDINITNCIAKDCGSPYNNNTYWEGGGFYCHSYSDRINISDCKVIGSRKHGFKMQGNHIKLTNCQVVDFGSNNMGYGFTILGPCIEGTNLSVVNTTKPGSGFGFEISTTTTYPAGTESRVLLSNVEVIGASCGMAVYGPAVGGRALVERNLNLSGFTIRDCPYQGIYILGTCEDIFLSNGQIYNCGNATSQKAGLEILPYSSNYFPNRVFVNNVISRNNYMGVKANNSGADNPYGILNIRTQGNTVDDSITGTWKVASLVSSQTIKTTLNEAIAGTEALNQDNYTQDSWAVLQDALEAAQATAADDAVTQADVEEALANLETALDELESVTPSTVDKTVLNEAINWMANSAPFAGGEEGMEAIKVGLMAHESIKTGRVVYSSKEYGGA